MSLLNCLSQSALSFKNVPKGSSNDSRVRESLTDSSWVSVSSAGSSWAVAPPVGWSCVRRSSADDSPEKGSSEGAKLSQGGDGWSKAVRALWEAFLESLGRRKSLGLGGSGLHSRA